jgi:hypothetical protein
MKGEQKLYMKCSFAISFVRVYVFFLEPVLLGVQRPKRREAECAREAWSNMILHDFQFHRQQRRTR